MGVHTVFESADTCLSPPNRMAEALDPNVDGGGTKNSKHETTKIIHRK